ncbi:MAG: radical SAM protein, partial [Pseudomonadota bacterium]
TATFQHQANPDFGEGRHVKTTRSICPVCLESLKADVFERFGQIWMDKSCTAHGRFSALLSSHARHYHEHDSERLAVATPCCSGGTGCGPAPSASAPGWQNHSCTVLIEITERCNLTCPTCFAGSSPQHSKLMDMATFEARLEGLLTGGKHNSDTIQLSGGEPTVHPHLLEMIDRLFTRGFMNVCINSNGIRLAREDYVARLSEIVARHRGAFLSVYLQFDGFDDATHARLRDRDDLLPLKQRALTLLLGAGITVHPVMTLTRGINEHEVGRFVDLAQHQEGLKHLVIQPAMYSGRYDNPRRVNRLTLGDAVNLVCEQSGLFTAEDFGPIPCSDPNCYGIAVALRTRGGLMPISRYFPRWEDWEGEDSAALVQSLTNTLDAPAAFGEAIRWMTSAERLGPLLDRLDDDEVDDLLETLIAAREGRDHTWDRLVMLSIKPFMDAWTYDQDRIDKCCVHILDDEGTPVSFCEFNAINRPRAARAQDA